MIEIYQNCPIFNDDAYDSVKNPEKKGNAILELIDGQPIKSNKYGVVRKDMGFEVVELDKVSESDLVVHDSKNVDPSYAFALSRLSGTSLEHVPVGVFRNVARPGYTSLVQGQLQSVISEKGAGDLHKLLNSGDTWQVK
mgnify:CR=1 FL=1